MELERGTGLAVWRQIESALAEDIRKSVFSPGDRLPNEIELAQRFGVNRHTVRRALGVLERGGLVRVEQGRGTFVHDYAINYLLGRRTRFTQNMQNIGLASSIEVVRGMEMVASAEVKKALGLSGKVTVTKLVTLSKAEGRAIGIADSYFETTRFPNIVQHVRETGSITKALKLSGVADYVRASSRVTARLPDEETARLLGQSRLQPILQVEAVNVDAEGIPTQYGVTRFSGDWVQLVVDPDN